MPMAGFGERDGKSSENADWLNGDFWKATPARELEYRVVDAGDEHGMHGVVSPSCLPQPWIGER
jgi:hypothetical protein